MHNQLSPVALESSPSSKQEIYPYWENIHTYRIFLAGSGGLSLCSTDLQELETKDTFHNRDNSQCARDESLSQEAFLDCA